MWKHPDGAGATAERTAAEYDEDAFRYFLDIEWARAERSNRPLRLLFATLEPVPGTAAPISSQRAARLFEALRLALRETDLIGWYRQHLVAAAVLCSPSDSCASDICELIEQRVREEVRHHWPAKALRSLVLRIVQLEPSGSTPTFGSSER